MRAIEGVQRIALAFSAHHGLSTKVKTPLRKGEPLFGYIRGAAPITVYGRHPKRAELQARTTSG